MNFVAELAGKIKGALRKDLPMLNLGCGGRFHPDWTNIDFVAHSPGVIAHDLRQPLPFKDGSCSVVYHSHVLEHFSRHQGRKFLQECCRVLVPGGILRVVVPDLETIARLYLGNLEAAAKGDEEAARRHEWMTIELLDQMTRERGGGEMGRYWKQNPMPAETFVIERMGHQVTSFLEKYRNSPASQQPQPSLPDPAPADAAAFRETGEVHKWMYDRLSLRRLLAETEFIDAKVCAANESAIPNFASYQLDCNPDGSTRKPDSLFMEVRKAVD